MKILFLLLSLISFNTGAETRLDYQLLQPATTEASATSSTTTTSGSDVLINSMTLTPRSGTYRVMFSTYAESNNNNADITFSIYAGGSLKTDSVRVVTPQIQGGVTPSLNFKAPVFINGDVTVNGSQAIEIRWKRSAGTATCTQRTLNITRIK